jgi:anthranilate phosphoribosyltransferase
MPLLTALNRLLDKHDLSETEMRAVMHAMMNGELSDVQIASFLIALRCKGESVDEIRTAVSVLRELVQRVPAQGEHLIDTCGTGGDGANTFNISTCAAFVVAAAGAQVAKHGNRSVSSHCGSADLLELAGVNLDLSAQQVADCVRQVGIGFLFAAKHHSAVRHTVAARKTMGVRSVFNLIGPMANPANAPHQLIGVYAKQWLMPVAQVLQQLGSRHVLVVHAEDGLDEISIAAVTDVVELRNGEILNYRLEPEQFGLQRAGLETLAVRSAQDSLNIIHAVLDNQPGAARDIVALNAGAAIYAADLTDSLTQGVQRAQQVIADGSARDKLAALVAYSKTLSESPS